VSKYAHVVEFKTEWAGDEVTARLHPLKFSDFMVIQSKIKDGEIAMLEAFYEMLPRYLITLVGAKDAAGAEITIDDLSNAYWTGLVTQLMVQLISAAQPSDPT
jgi:hypothetical protein